MWYLDGTFKSRPLLFAQLYVIHYSYMDNVVPGVYVLMADKRQESYNAVFSTLRDALPDEQRAGPVYYSVDFELAAANALKEVFPRAKEAFCFFHFSQSL